MLRIRKNLRTVFKNIKPVDRITGIKKREGQILGVIRTNYKRHTIMKEVEKEDETVNKYRKNAFDYISDFANKIMPQIENIVEERLLEQFKLNLDEKEQELVDDAYRMRKYRQDITRKVVPPVDKPKELEPTPKIPKDFGFIYSSMKGSGLRKYTYKDIGKYTFFPQRVMERLFPFNGYGQIAREYDELKHFAVMCREEGLKLGHLFSYISTPLERKKALPRLSKIMNGEFNFKEEIKKTETFTLFFQDIAHSLRDVIKSYNDINYLRLFSHADPFDSLVTILTRSMGKTPFNKFMMIPHIRERILKQIVDEIYEKVGTKYTPPKDDFEKYDKNITEDTFNEIQSWEEIKKHFQGFRFEFDYDELYKFCVEKRIRLKEDLLGKTKTFFTINFSSYQDHCEYQWRPRDMRDLLPLFKGFNTGALLFGEKGSGKSGIMNYLHAWAKDSGWLIYPIHDARKWVQKEQNDSDIERHSSGLYLTHEYAKEFLEHFKKVNYSLLRKTRVNLKEYGKMDMAGNRDGDMPAVPIYYDVQRQVFTDSWKEFNSISEERINVLDYPDHSKRLLDILPQPKTLLQIVDAGIENERFATCAIAEILLQTKLSENIKQMILIDNYNELFRPSIYLSYKYANYRNFRNSIPPYDFALVRLFMKFDGHQINQGVKVFSTSLEQYEGHNFLPEKINFQKGYSIKVDNLTLNDLRNAMYQRYHSGRCMQILPEKEVQQIYSITQGNWKQWEYHEKFPFKFRINLDRYEMRKLFIKELYAK